jgi:uncharacterized membrane protein
VNSQADKRARTLQLTRLERLSDVVFAAVLLLVFALIPRPGDEGWHWHTIGAFLADNIITLVLVAIGVAVTIIYWLQNNELFSKLERTDTRHAALSIVQLFFLLLFLYSLRLGVELEASAATRALESVTAAMVGIAASWGWSYATKNRRLLHDDVSDEATLALRDRIMAEPITAVFTIPFAFTPILWEVSWLAYPLAVKLLARRRRK